MKLSTRRNSHTTSDHVKQEPVIMFKNTFQRQCFETRLIGIDSIFRVWRLRLTLVSVAFLGVACGAPSDTGGDDAEQAAESSSDAVSEPVVLPSLEVAEGDGLPVTLPDNLQWSTNEEDPVFASPRAIKGGTFRASILSFPLTLRIVGPDSNGSFATYLRSNNLSPITYHPITRRVIPSLATHWAYGPDGRTIYYRLNQNARWSDGIPVTADDYIYAVQFMRSKEIVAPWYNNFYSDRIRDIKKYDEHTIGIQGADPKSEDELHSNYAFNPQPKHFHKLSKDWVKEFNWIPQPSTGPYHVGEIRKGRYIDLVRTEDWWGDELKFYRNRFNPTRIRIKVIRDDNTAWQHFLKGELDTHPAVLPNYWHEKAKGELFDKGYIKKYWFYNRLPVPAAGMYLNTSNPLLQEKAIREGIAHATNVEKVIQTILRNDYERLPTFQLGFGEYDNTSIEPREFDLDRANTFFESAGFVERGKDGIRVRDGVRLSFTITYGRPAHTERVVVLKEEAKKAGLEFQLSLLDSAASFKQMLEKKHEIAWLTWNSSGITPRYWEHFHSDNANKTQTNNITNHANPEMDKLIMQFRTSSLKSERIQLAHTLEQMVHDSAAVIPTFQVPYTREVAWRWVELPDHLGTPSTGELFNSETNSAGLFSSGGLFWIDETLKKETLDAKSDNISFAPVTIINKEFRR